MVLVDKDIIQRNQEIFINGYNQKNVQSISYDIHVKEIITDENGYASLEDLELGKYYALELESSSNNVLDNTNNPNEYLLTNNPSSESSYFLYFKDNLLDGTYKLVVSLYDNNNFIGEVYQYIIIK